MAAITGKLNFNDPVFEMSKKSLLYFIPFNIMKNNAGAIRTAWNYLEAFHHLDMDVDYVHSNDTWGGPMSDTEVDDLKQTGLVRNIYHLNRKPENIRSLRHWLAYRIQRLGRDVSSGRSLPSFVTTYNQYLFNEILKKHRYDYIIISYAHWANLVRENRYTGNAKLIIDTHDFMTAQERVWKKFNVGRAFNKEIKRLSLFDAVWTVSADERYLFQQFVDKKVVLVPFCAQDHTMMEAVAKNYDIIYVGGDNVHNIKAADWFFKEVYPLLDASVRYCVVGRIHRYVPDRENIYKVPYAADLEDYYPRAKLAICPMLSGTGVKVKVVEALSYALPVVCSPRGVDGLLNKTENGCVVAASAPDFAAAIQKLLQNPDFYNEMRLQAGTFFQKNHKKENLYTIIGNALNC